MKPQAQLLDISRGTTYDKPRPVSERDLALMRRIDELHLEHPFASSRLHVGTLMARAGIEAPYKKPNTSRKHPRHPIYPYLLRGVKSERAAQFTSLESTDTLRRHGIANSMDGRGRWRDNVFVERRSKSIKYEDVYLKAYETVSVLRTSLAADIDFYNTRRPHTAHRERTPRKPIALPCRHPGWQPEPPEHGLSPAACVRRKRRRRRG